MNLCGVDCITHIVAFSVGYVCNKTLGFAEFLADEFDDIDVLHLVVTADIVYFSDSSFVNYKIDGLAVIFYI